MDYVKTHFENAEVISVNFEDKQFESLKTDTALYHYIKSKIKEHKTNFVFIDEIQEVEHFENCLRNLLSEQLCDITVTGSNAKMLSGELSTLLSGRYMEFQIHALDYREFLQFFFIRKYAKFSK